ncbi:MAG: ABC transporter permease [Saprospiraceae bacterium]|nr:ABC transporter permease [Saprospiraceae bacterium]MCF8248571.1 ABC transporter permease [Saprospiraceae bacterium]MCF8280262.1 ABC transporter permease [Bacteroidales bacterium]MCF8310304.1 ABC transporter permease [Saprospiraceae bacterium]MCF8439256.1 ABC transporter permease [Saprospiraceae bacterium]
MFQQFIRLTFRSLWRNKSFSFLNIAGLSTGLTVAMLIGLWMVDEFNYDKFHENYGQLYQLKMSDYIDGDLQTWPSMPLALADELRKSFPEVRHVAEADWCWEHGLKFGDKLFQKNGFQIHGDFLKMFSFPLVSGSAETALDDPNSIVLTQKMGTSLFGHENYQDMLGKVIKLDNFSDVVVTGVIKDLPENSSLQFNFLIPFSLFEQQDWVKNSRTSWDNNSFQIYLELQPGVDGLAFSEKINDIIQQHHKETKAEVTAHALADWRLRGKFENGKVAGGYIEYIMLFGIIGLFVLLIACINFMNLSTARSERRSKEVGVRKTLGSLRGQLIGQFLGEAVIMAVFALVLSIGILELALPGFNSLTNKALHTPYSNPIFWASALVFTILTGIMAGSYPAFFLSSFQPLKVLKGASTFQGKSAEALLPRKILVISQFTISIALIISTLVVYQQIQYTKERPIGYDPNRVVMMVMSGDLVQNYKPLKNEMLASGMVTGVTMANSPITNVYSRNKDYQWKGKNPSDDAMFATVVTADDYFTTLNVTLKDGRFFSKDFPADSTAIILNESAVKRMGLVNPLEETIDWQNKTYRIVGVTNDVVMVNPFEKIEPTVFLSENNRGNEMMFRIAPNVSTSFALAQLEPIFKTHNPSYPFNYTFVDEFHSRKFASEELIGKLAGLFAGLAIFISCLGLFGLSAYMAERRTKEIGIRKVLGATTTNLWAMLSKEFVVLVLVSCFIAVPLAAYFLKDWLDKFEYRIGLNWWVFAIAGLAALAISLLTVSFQSIKAALANPVKSLRSE